MATDKDALTTGCPPASSQKAKTANSDLDDVANLLGALSVKTKQCDVCQIELTKDESSSGMIRCTECEDNLAARKRGRQGSTNDKKRRNRDRVSKTKIETDGVKDRMPRNRRLVTDSDDENEGEGDWVVPEGQRTKTSRGKAGGSEDENAEGGGEWIGSEDEETDKGASTRISSSHKRVVSPDATDEEDDDASDTLSSSKGEVDDDSSISELSCESLVSSSKIEHLRDILNRESKLHKFIVFSQFTSMLNLIEPFLKEDELSFTRYDGSMRNDAREASLNQLRNNKKVRILLCSLKCGSLGLNLTAASRVVILEPFWNPVSSSPTVPHLRSTDTSKFVEEQAIDRVHRLNQTVDVVVYKMTIANSVEERILKLQEKKRALASAAIEGKAVAKLSMQDILNLFRRDAERDPRHDVHDGLGAKTSVLHPAAAAASVAQSQGGESRRATPPVTDRGNGVGSKEDPVFGRRW
jgi:hypothetical protein